MDRETARKWAKLYKAYADGKTIQCFDDVLGDWRDLKDPDFIDELPNYRIKEPASPIVFGPCKLMSDKDRLKYTKSRKK